MRLDDDNADWIKAMKGDRTWNEYVQALRQTAPVDDHQDRTAPAPAPARLVQAPALETPVPAPVQDKQDRTAPAPAPARLVQAPALETPDETRRRKQQEYVDARFKDGKDLKVKVCRSDDEENGDDIVKVGRPGDTEYAKKQATLKENVAKSLQDTEYLL